jgi:hypothetical protein
MNTSSIKEYIERNQARKNIRAKYITGIIWYFHEGTWINQKQYDKLYPVYHYLANANTIHNCDKTKVI